MSLNDKTKQALKEQNQALHEEVQALKADKADAEAKMKELRLIHLRQEDRINQLRKDINEITADNETLCDSQVQLAGINRTLRQNIAALDTNVDQWEKFALGERDQRAKLNAYTDELEERLEKSEVRARDLKERKEELEERNEELEERSEVLEDLLVTEKLESQAFEAENKELERKNKALWKTVRYQDELIDEDQVEVMRMRKGVIKLKQLWEAGELD